jgi:hypothetical protein
MSQMLSLSTISSASSWSTVLTSFFCKALLTNILRLSCNTCLILLATSSPMINLHLFTWPYQWTIPSSDKLLFLYLWGLDGPMNGLEFVTLKCGRQEIESCAFILLNSHNNFQILVGK